jgi:hypothetical protein
MKALDVVWGFTFLQFECQGIPNPLAISCYTLSHSRLQPSQKQHVQLVIHLGLYRGHFLYICTWVPSVQKE